MSGQTKLDEFFAKKPSTTIKRAAKTTNDDFDQIFSEKKRQRVERKASSSPSQQEKKRANDFDEIFNTKKLRRSTKKDEENEDEIDLFDMFKTKSNEVREEIPSKDYVHLQPVVITGGQWLSKERPIEETLTSSIPDDQRNLMKVQFVPLNSPKKITSNGKSFHKQSLSSNSSLVRKENLQSCYNSLLETMQKSRSTKKTFSEDCEEEKTVDFFDLPVRKKNFNSFVLS